MIFFLNHRMLVPKIKLFMVFTNGCEVLCLLIFFDRQCLWHKCNLFFYEPRRCRRQCARHGHKCWALPLAVSFVQEELREGLNALKTPLHLPQGATHSASERKRGKGRSGYRALSIARRERGGNRQSRSPHKAHAFWRDRRGADVWRRMRYTVQRFTRQRWTCQCVRFFAATDQYILCHQHSPIWSPGTTLNMRLVTQRQIKHIWFVLTTRQTARRYSDCRLSVRCVNEYDNDYSSGCTDKHMHWFLRHILSSRLAFDISQNVCRLLVNGAW